MDHPPMENHRVNSEYKAITLGSIQKGGTSRTEFILGEEKWKKEVSAMEAIKQILPHLRDSKPILEDTSIDYDRFSIKRGSLLISVL